MSSSDSDAESVETEPSSMCSSDEDKESVDIHSGSSCLQGPAAGQDWTWIGPLKTRFSRIVPMLFLVPSLLFMYVHCLAICTCSDLFLSDIANP